MDIQNNNFNEAKQIVCWACRAKIGAEDNFCRKCGKGQGKFVPWYYTHWGVIVLTFALGPLSLYFIWRSPSISYNTKWIYTAIISIITWYAAVTIYHIWIFIQNFMGSASIY
ncbi:MAG: zinc ribbon domain-containing protein [Elusimicrobia bacterium]|nr:zinc ribbon domain-containing protein [Elusimicrobiota bacterium]